MSVSSAVFKAKVQTNAKTSKEGKKMKKHVTFTCQKAAFTLTYLCIAKTILTA